MVSQRLCIRRLRKNQDLVEFIVNTTYLITISTMVCNSDTSCVPKEKAKNNVVMMHGAMTANLLRRKSRCIY